MDFNWPLKKVWGGYINPYYSQKADCYCDGTGYSSEAKVFYDQWYGYTNFDAEIYGVPPLTPEHPKIIELAQRNLLNSPDYYGTGEHAERREVYRLFDLFKNQWCHHLNQDDVDALKDRLLDLKDPTPEEVNAWSIGCMGHDSINCYTCVKVRCEREGVPHMCGICDGSGTMWPTENIELKYEEWEPENPPEGEGYQLWETTSEGSPITPVFKSLEELCEFCENNNNTFGSFKASKEEWINMLDSDAVCHREGNMVFV